jgi:NAD(P)-dependent dehydrogenase (short-subunit alcohol dehydrogenase family)
MKLKDKVAIVTGATKGIGEACAYEYAKEGAKVVVTGRTVELGEKVAQKIQDELGGEALFVKCDVSQAAEVQNLIDKTVERFGRLDIMLANAGTNAKSDFLDITEEDWDWVIDVDLKGTFLCGQYAARQMVKEGHGGVIINMSSVMAVLGLKTQAHYCAAKGGINQLTKVMALSLIDYDIRVNAIGPGPIMTELMQRVAEDKELMDTILRRTPMGRIGTCEEVAKCAVFLACDDSSFIMGQCIYPDGGRMIQSFDRDQRS